MNKILPSKIISGIMSWGKWGKKFSTNQMSELIEYNFNAGINSFDSADIYGDYSTENEFGKALSASNLQREKLVLITKCGIQFTSKKEQFEVKHYDYSSKHIRFSVEKSLKNLKTDYIDVFLLHRPSPLMNPEEIGVTISKLKEENKIKSFGVSNFNMSQISLIQKTTDVEWNQIECSISKNQALDNGVLDYAIKKKIGIMAWGPLGNYYKKTQEKKLQLLINSLSNKYSANEDQIIIAWLLKHPAKIHPVVGSTNKQRISSYIKAIEIDMDIIDWFAIFI